MSRLGCTCLAWLAFFLVAIRAGAAIRCHRSYCLDEANITACITNHTTELVDCNELTGNTSDFENDTACVKYRVTGATYRQIAGADFSPCKGLEVRTCFQYYSDSGLDLGGRLQEAMQYAGVNETVLSVHMCHRDACNAAHSRRHFSVAALAMSCLSALVCQRVRY